MVIDCMPCLSVWAADSFYLGIPGPFDLGLCFLPISLKFRLTFAIFSVSIALGGSKKGSLSEAVKFIGLGYRIDAGMFQAALHFSGGTAESVGVGLYFMFV